MPHADLVADRRVVVGQEWLRRVLRGQLHLEDHPGRHEDARAAGVRRRHRRRHQRTPLATQAGYDSGEGRCVQAGG